MLSKGITPSHGQDILKENFTLKLKNVCAPVILKLGQYSNYI